MRVHDNNRNDAGSETRLMLEDIGESHTFAELVESGGELQQPPWSNG
jgi:hypothetical protein